MYSVRFQIPATIANLGPGFDVLGLALAGLCNTYEISLCTYPSRLLSVTGVDSERVPSNKAKNLTLLAAHKMARFLGEEKACFAIKQEQQLPISGGLGSSAAACLAGAYAAAYLLGNRDNSKILEIAAELDGICDNLAPAYHGGMTIALGDAIIPVSQGCELWIVVITPSIRLSTKQARLILPKELPQKDWVRQMALSCALVAAWQQGNLEGIAMALKDPYAEPRRAPLISGFYELRKKALDKGALGFGISGAGPSSFALFSQEDLAKDFSKKHHGYCGTVSKKGLCLC